MGVAVISMLLNLYRGVQRKMTQEFRAYGPNVVLAPGLPALLTHPHPSPTEEENHGRGRLASTTGSGVLDEAVMGLVQEFSQRSRGVMAAPVLYAVVRLKRIPPEPRLPEFENLVAVGTDLAALRGMNPGWRWGETQVAQVPPPVPEAEASRASGTGESASATGYTCNVGSHIASSLRVGLGDTIYFEPSASAPGTTAGAGSTCHVASVLTTGSSEDDQMFLPLEELQRVMGMTGKISLVQLRLPGDTREIEKSIGELSKTLPGVEVRPIRQIVYSEGRVLGVIQWFLLSVTALILVIIAICLMATMTAIVLERRKDIGVMKALGASDHQVMRLFLAEGAAFGIVAGCAGFILGSFCASVLALHLFGVTLSPIWWNLPLDCGLAVLLALAASVFPVRIVRGIHPAVVLKGD
jgi:putative ABC transport system permease protein